MTDKVVNASAIVAVLFAEPELAAQTQRQFAGRKHLPIVVVTVDFSQVASSTGLTAYDASCLWLARHRAAPLVTLDRRLAAAAAA